MSGVEVLPLGEIVKPTRPRVKPSDYPDLPFIGMEHVEPHSMRLLGTVLAATMKSSAVHFKPGDVLYGRLRPYLNKVYRPAFEGLCSAEFIVMPENERMDGGYLQYFLNSSAFVRFATQLNTGDRPRVDFDQLAPYEMPLPRVVEQRRIVAELEKQFSRLDEAVANLKRVAAGLARYRASTLTESFAMRPGWAVSSYGDVGVVTTGFTPPTSDEENFGGAVPFFKPTDLDAGENVVLAREYLSDRGLSKGRLISANSVLVTCIGATIGKTGFARVACATNQQINAVSPDPAAVDPSFLYWWTVSPQGQEQIVSNASATTLPILNKSKFSALAVPLPPIAEQRRILAELDRRLSIVREVETEVDASLKRANVLRQAVLSSAFG